MEDDYPKKKRDTRFVSKVTTKGHLDDYYEISFLQILIAEKKWEKEEFLYIIKIRKKKREREERAKTAVNRTF